MLTRNASHEPAAAALDLRDVTVRFNGTVALDGINLQIQQGAQVAVVGPNGAGKSTLFGVIAGTLRPSRGQVQVYGSGPGGHICIGFVPQRSRIDWRFPVSVADVVMMGRVGKIGFLRWPRRADWQRVEAALARVGMQDLARRQIGELSGGQQQRVFLARAIAQEAELLLLDEPLTGLDLPSQEAILQILADLRAQGVTTLVATHDLNQAADRFDRMLLLNRRIVADGPPDFVLTTAHLSAAYGDHLHLVETDKGALVVADSCCQSGAEAGLSFHAAAALEEGEPR